MCDPQELASATSSLGLGKCGTLALLFVPVTVMSFLAYLCARARPADNSYCYVCHLDYQTEPLAENHRALGVGCAKCHGPSDAHVEDEAAETAPETMYARARINPGCHNCHAGPALPPECRSAISAVTDATGVCTDCHGEHRLTERTRKWDRETGELIWSSGEGGMGM